jgi:hypothetical protein
VAVAASLLAAAAGLGGVALLAWWAVAFGRADAMLWMVPAGLVLLDRHPAHRVALRPRLWHRVPAPC